MPYKHRPVVELACPTCGDVRRILFRSRATINRCGHCARYKGGRVFKSKSIHGRRRGEWAEFVKKNGVPGAKKFTTENKGEKSANWKGGVTKPNKLARGTEEIAIWRQSVFKRDGFTCQCCRKRGSRLTAHHIKSFAKHKELRCDVQNGVTLCEGCHVPIIHGGASNNPGRLFSYPFTPLSELCPALL